MRERFEWVQIWKEKANDYESGRILLIGDSIADQYYKAVKDKFKGYNVDKLALSYAIDAPSFNLQIAAMLADEYYQVIHFNNGLHGKDIPHHVYSYLYEETIKMISKHCGKLILSTVTEVMTTNHDGLNKEWSEVVFHRNNAIKALGDKYGLCITDLHAAALSLNVLRIKEDGFHFTADGSRALSEKVCEAIGSAIEYGH